MPVYSLAIETSVTPASAALLSDDKLIDELFIQERKEASALITVKIKELLDKNNISPHDLSFVSVGIGPGSYTGLRVGLATAKGLCLALRLPLVGVSSLQALVHGHAFSNKTKKGKIYVGLFDANKGNVYISILDNELNVLIKDERVRFKQFKINDLLNRNTIFISPHKEILLLNGIKRQLIINLDARAYFIGLVAYRKYPKLKYDNNDLVKPNYLKNNYL